MPGQKQRKTLSKRDGNFQNKGPEALKDPSTLVSNIAKKNEYLRKIKQLELADIDRGKLEKIEVYLDTLFKKIKAEFSNDYIKELAKARNKDAEDRTDLEEHVILLIQANKKLKQLQNTKKENQQKSVTQENSGKKNSESKEVTTHDIPEEEFSMKSFLLSLVKAPLSWAVAGSILYSSVLVVTNGFEKMAKGAEKIFGSSFDLSSTIMAAVYAVSIGTMIAVTEIRRRINAKRKSLILENKRREHHSIIENVNRKLSSPDLQDPVPAEQLIKIRRELVDDEQFFEDVDNLREAGLLFDILKESHISNGVLQGFDGDAYFPAEIQLLVGRMSRLVKINEPKERKKKLKTMFSESTLFKRKYTELFMKERSGLYKNQELLDAVKSHEITDNEGSTFQLRESIPTLKRELNEIQRN